MIEPCFLLVLVALAAAIAFMAGIVYERDRQKPPAPGDRT